jgi:hypothetical protein
MEKTIETDNEKPRKRLEGSPIKSAASRVSIARGAKANTN